MSTPAEDAAFYRGQIKGLEIAANTVSDYIEKFALTEDALTHAKSIRSGLCNAANLLSLRVP